MKKIFIVFLLFIPLTLWGQSYYYTGESYVETVDRNDYDAYLLRPDNSILNIPHVNVNYFESVDTKGYMLDIGDEYPLSTNNNMDGMVITGNKFKWNGTPGTPITHGMFMGYNINMLVKYNYMDGVPYNILFKSGDDDGVNMVNTSGGAAYNIVKNPKLGVRSKGQDGVIIYNNTFYNSYTSGTFIYLDGNHDRLMSSSPQGTRIKNNIFYSVYDLQFFYIEGGCLSDFECDYNIYYCENSTGHYPRFSIGGTNYTWSQWQALGYDLHSVVIDPDFINLIDFVPAVRLDYGTNLGSTWESGLSTTATWTVGSIPNTTTQNSTWQVGARIYAASTPTTSTYYISPSGNNATGNGSISQPWQTLSYAISNVKTYGNIIHVAAGTYPPITTQMHLTNGISIEGEGRDITVIPLTYSSGRPCIKLETWLGWENKTTVGHQHISGIKFVGSTTPGTPIGQVAIGVNFRNYVAIYDCWFEDFSRNAVWFTGEPTYNDWTIANPYDARIAVDSEHLPFSDSFCEGNKFYNNQVHNCCGLIGLPADRQFSGALEVATQDGMLIYGNNMTALGRSGTNNGVPIKLIHDCGFNKNVKIYNNTIDAGHKDTNYWQFSMEIWWNLGGIEIYNNTLKGSIDFCDSWDQYGVGYGVKIYDNDIGYSTSSNLWEPGIRFEGTHVDDYVFRNKFHNINIGIEVNNENSSGVTTWNGVYIYDNLMVNLSGPSWQCWGIYWGGSGVITNTISVWQNIYIQQNTIVAASTSIAPTTYGIMLPTVQDVNNLYIENNILINWERGAILGYKTRIQATNIYIRNNLIYDSYNNNDPVYLNGYPTSGITYSGTVKENPLFISSSDFHLQATSPCIGAGLYISWLTTDYDGNGWLNPPSIGAYELYGDGVPVVSTSPVTSITGTTAVSGGVISSDGGQAVTASENQL